MTIPSPNHRENGDTKKMFGSPNGEFGEDPQTLTIVDSAGAEESTANGIPETPLGTKPKIILHRQVRRKGGKIKTAHIDWPHFGNLFDRSR